MLPTIVIYWSFVDSISCTVLWASKSFLAGFAINPSTSCFGGAVAVLRGRHIFFGGGFGSVAMLLGRSPLLFLRRDGPMTGKEEGFSRGSSGILKGGGLTNGERFSRSSKNQWKGLDCSHCELEEGVLRSPSSRRERLGGGGNIPKSADARPWGNCWRGVQGLSIWFCKVFVRFFGFLQPEQK